tara:strand:- start:979 stop:1593 length:615 start_codon:yes stop_codon:yes gene_type:complete
MHLTRLTAGITLLAFTLACGDGDDGDSTSAGPSGGSLKVITVEDLPADPERSGDLTYFSLRDNAVVDGAEGATDKWDLAFQSVTILTNSGSSGPGDGAGLVLTGVNFDELDELPSDGWNADANGAPALAQGAWYTYTGAEGRPPHAILLNPGVVLGIRTADGRYAKMEISSYYKGGAAVPGEGDQSRYYNFRYVFQPDGSRSFD